MDEPALELTDQPTQEALDFLFRQLSAFNDADVGPSQRQPLAVFLRDTEGAIVAGLSGYTAWGWLYVQWLWIAEAQRGRRLAARMLTAAEDEALRRGCHHAFIDTFNPAAERAYRRQGYAPFGRLEDFPSGRARIFLRKPL